MASARPRWIFTLPRLNGKAGQTSNWAPASTLPSLPYCRIKTRNPPIDLSMWMHLRCNSAHLDRQSPGLDAARTAGRPRCRVAGGCSARLPRRPAVVAAFGLDARRPLSLDSLHQDLLGSESDHLADRSVCVRTNRRPSGRGGDSGGHRTDSADGGGGLSARLVRIGIEAAGHKRRLVPGSPALRHAAGHRGLYLSDDVPGAAAGELPGGLLDSAGDSGADRHARRGAAIGVMGRSEEHTSELQSLTNL